MAEVSFSNHALTQMSERGISKEEVIETIETGERVPAKKGRKAFRKNFTFEKEWAGKIFHIKQVMPVVVEEKNRLVVVTAYSFYF